MHLSTKTRYGLRILVQIALDTGNESAVKGRVIAKKQELSEPYMEQIMIPLKNAGFVRTIRGCHGGYALNKNVDEMTTLEVIELFQGKIELVDCKSDDQKSCSRFNRCPTSRLWNRLSKVLREEASKITVGQLVEDSRKKQTLDYVI